MSVSDVATATLDLSRGGRDRAAPSVARAAAADILPMAVGVAPFGTVLGVTAVAQGQNLPTGLGLSFLYFGGTAQLTAMTMLTGGASALAVVLAVVVVNARLLMYGAALEPHFRRQPRWFRWLGPQFIVDQTFMPAMARTDLADPARFRRYWFWLAAILTSVWMASIAVGLLLGPVVPEDSPLGFAVIAMFVGMLVLKVTDRPALAAAVVGGGVAVATAWLPQGAGVVLGAVAGVVAGVITSRRSS